MDWFHKVEAPPALVVSSKWWETVSLWVKYLTYAPQSDTRDQAEYAYIWFTKKEERTSLNSEYFQFVCIL